jgi:hypothetical protein
MCCCSRCFSVVKGKIQYFGETVEVVVRCTNNFCAFSVAESFVTYWTGGSTVDS